MLVTMKTFLLWHGKSCLAGKQIDLPDEAALAYIRTGQAEPVAIEKKQIEAATIEPPLRNAMRTTQPQFKRR